MNGQTRVWTKTLTSETLTISAEDNVQQVSWQCTSGTVEVQGDMIFQGVASNAISGAVGEGGILSSYNIGKPISGVTITAVGGDTDVMLLV